MLLSCFLGFGPGLPDPWEDHRRTWYHYFLIKAARDGERGMLSPDERVRILLESEPNSWVALSSDESKVVGRGKSYDEVVEQAKTNGEDDPLVIKTPEEWDPLVF